MLPSLPDKYYLAHAHELFEFLDLYCQHLLQSEHRQYLASFEQLSEDAQCLLVRILSRKPRILNLASLKYAEIVNFDSALLELLQQGYVSDVQVGDWEEFLSTLNKPQLLSCLSEVATVNASACKPVLISAAKAALSADHPSVIETAQQYLVRRQQTVLDYLLFLFFGDVRNRFQKFAMRDLGVLKTRKSSDNMVARFANISAALSTFDLHIKQRDFSRRPKQIAEELADYLLRTPASGLAAQQLKDKLLVKVADALVADLPDKAVSLWRASGEHIATTRWIRHQHKHGDRTQLKSELDTLREQDLDANTRVFLEDFYARKYLGKRTSVFTDMLAESAHVLRIDEAYINDVEEAVTQLYQQQGVVAYFSENTLWRALFAFTFWDLLLGPEQAQHSEFDRLPAVLGDNRFYLEFQTEIDQQLVRLQDIAEMQKDVTRLATSHYGVVTGLFSWHAGLLDSLFCLLRNAPADALIAVLLRMAKNYQHCNDGYPDLMVVDQGQLRFEEIKAPGDVLRANQLTSINRLRKAGFQVEVRQVEWATDPQQTYAVVDIETTGVSKELHAITEIAIVKVRNNEIVSEWSSLINPQRPIPAQITNLTGITNQMVAEAPLFQQIADQLQAELENTIFVAHNVGFDYGFIKAAYGALSRPFRMPKFCTVSNSRKTFPGLASYGLGNLSRHFDIDLDNAHRALDDARATAHLLRLIQHARADQAQT